MIVTSRYVDNSMRMAFVRCKTTPKRDIGIMPTYIDVLLLRKWKRALPNGEVETIMFDETIVRTSA